MVRPIFSLFLLFAISSVAYGASLGPSSRIIGGENAENAEFAYQASLRSSGRHFCGGSLISLRHVLTAAHCIVSYLGASSYDDLTVITGTNSLARGGDTHGVQNITSHRSYVGGAATSWRYDIAVLTLTKEITESASQYPIGLPIEDTPDDVVAVVSGWGRVLFPGNSLPTALQKANLTIVSNTACQEDHSLTIYDDQICAFATYGIGVCSGDSGGPLVYNNTVVGVVSWGRTCAVGAPDVYARVYHFLFFIGQILYNTEHDNS